MRKKLKYLLFILPLCFLQCQKLKEADKVQKEKQLENCKQYDYCLQDSLMYYKGKPFQGLEKIEDYIKVFGKYNRMEEETYRGTKRTYYYFKNEVTGIKDLRDSSILLIDPKQTDEENNYKKIDDVIKKYGKYDSIRIEIITPKTERHYIWDKAGFSAWATNNTIHSVFIQFTTKSVNDFLLNKDPKTLNKEEKAERNKMIWIPYSGKICFNGGVVNVGLPNPDSWNTAIRKMGISGSDYDPGGDSKQAIRRIYKEYKGKEVLFNIMKETLSEKNGGGDIISSIDISW